MTQRVNLSLPVELLERLRAMKPEINWSRVASEALACELKDRTSNTTHCARFEDRRGADCRM